MDLSIAPFAGVEQLINAGVSMTLANASATWQGGAAFGVIFDSTEGGRFISDAPITAQRCTVSLCVANCPGITEGVDGLVINAAAWRVASAVVPDTSGWATFSVVQE